VATDSKVFGTDLKAPWNRLVAALTTRGDRLDEHQPRDGQHQALKTVCPCGNHTTPGRDFAFAERPDGSVQAWSFAGCDVGQILEILALTREDLRTAPDGTVLEGGVWINPYLGNDVTNAELLVRWFGQDMRWCHGLGWLRWDGRRWAPDHTNGTWVAKKMVRKLFAEASAQTDGDRAKQITAIAIRIGFDGGIYGALKLAIPDLLIEATQLDADPWIINTQNGTFDYRTKQLRPHCREDLITRLAGGAYRPGVRHTTWDGFLTTATAGKAGLLQFLPRAAGYSSTGSTREDAVFVCHGPGGSGKTSFVGALHAALGDYASNIPIDELVGRRVGGSGHHEAIASLAGKRLVTAVEASEDDRLREGLFKTITGGDPLRVSLKGKPSFDFTPVFKLWMATNEVPHMRADDSGLRRRIHKLPFDNPPKQADTKLKDRLKADQKIRDAVLTWMIEGGLDWLRQGLAPPACVVDATTAMWASLDQLAQFFEDRLIFGQEADFKLPAKDLQETYDGWSEDEGIPQKYRVSAKRRAARLRAKGCSEDRDTEGIRGRFWWGVRLRTDDDPRSDAASDQPSSDTCDTCVTSSQEPLIESLPAKLFETRDEATHVTHEDPDTEPLELFKAEHILVESTADLEAVLRDILTAPAVSLDLETTGLDPFNDRICLAQLATDPGFAYVVDCRKVPATALQSVLDQAKTLVIHNAKFELRMLAAAGLKLPSDIGRRLRDTMVASQLLDAGNRRSSKEHYHRLENVVARALGVALDKSEQTSDWSGELTEAQLGYAAADASVLLPLRDALATQIAEAHLGRVAEIENRCVPAMAWLENSGVRFDLDRLAGLVDHVKVEAEEAEAKLNAAAGRTLNWRSPKQILELLREQGLDISDTAEATLKRVAGQSEIARLLLDHRKAQSMLRLYGKDFDKHVQVDSRIHADFLQLGSRAGRMSCTGPNLQQVPNTGAYRSCFRAPEGRKLIKADYSQIELRIAAEITQDPDLLEAYRTGEDLHTLTAQRVLGKDEVTKADRTAAKALNFGLLYGMGAPRLREHAKTAYGVDLTAEQAGEYRAKFFAAYKGLRRWHRQQPDGEIETRTLAGRRRIGVEKFTEKLNTPVQGTGADGLKLALALLFERRDQMPSAFPVLVVHDEIVIEGPADQAADAEAWVRAAMVDGMRDVVKEVPVEVEATVADSWAGA
jgi:P4 family phage/plasmid primase-like protien